MKDEKMMFTAFMVLVAIIMIIVLWIMAMVGAMDLTDGCLYRYNFDENKTLSSATKITKTVTLKANANYSILSAEEKDGGVSIDPSGYGKWLNTNLRVTPGQDVRLDVKGDVSLCKAYLPANNLQQVSDKMPGKVPEVRIPIPRVEDNSPPVTLTFDARTDEWRNIAEVFKNDKLLVSLLSDKKTTASNITIPNSLSPDGTMSDDCREGKRNYSPICGRYSLWNAHSKYVTGCEFKNKCRQLPSKRVCSLRVIVCLEHEWVEQWESCYKNVYSTPPEPYKYGPDGGIGEFTSPYYDDLSKLLTNFNRNCDAEKAFIESDEYQKKRYFWFSADNAAGLLYRFDGNEEPTSKKNRGSNYSFVKFEEDQSLAKKDDDGNATDYKIIMSTIYDGSGPSYLQYRFHDGDGNFADNTGGYSLNIKQTKCRRTNGNSMDGDADARGLVKYVVAGYGKDPNNDMSGLSSKIFLANVNGSGQIAATDDGYLWMKINNVEDDYKDSFGQYQLQFLTSIEEGGFFRDILNPLFEGLKGKIKASAITIFKNMTCYKKDSGSCTNFFTYIRAILTLYVMFFGMLFLLGSIKINQTEFVIRVIKIAFVAGLMNESTFEFFNLYVFDFVTQFSDDIMSNMSGYSIVSGSNTISNPFMFLNEVMTKFFMSSTFAAQLMSTLSMGLSGVLYFIIIVVSIGIIMIVAFRAIAVYLMAFMAIAVLIGLAPLFLTFILFERTWYLFDNWVKFMFRYMLEPIILLAGIIILTQLFTIYLDYVLGYSVCWKCAIPLKIPFPTVEGVTPAFLDIEIFCLNWFAPWGFDHRSSQMGLNMQNIIALLMIAYCMWGYVDFASMITGRLAGGAGGPSATAMGGALTGAIESKALESVGLDAQSRADMKQGARQRLKSMEKGDKENPLDKGNRHDVKPDSSGSGKPGAGGKGASGAKDPNKGGGSWNDVTPGAKPGGAGGVAGAGAPNAGGKKLAANPKKVSPGGDPKDANKGVAAKPVAGAKKPANPQGNKDGN